jgi:mannose-6-phosphate isomerase-like protein (cupin superfamily)
MSVTRRHHRRVVTGHTADGRSTIASDGPASRAFDFVHMPGMSNQLLWATDAQGQPISVELDNPVSYVPERGGTRLMIVTFPPDAALSSPGFNPQAAAQEQLDLLPGLAELFEPDAPGFHRTQTVDYGVVLDGEIELHLDEAAPVRLKRGEAFVQNGTRHAWRNPSSSPATLAVVLVGAPTTEPYLKPDLKQRGG